MSVHLDLPVYKSCYDLTKLVFETSKDMDKLYKYSLGAELRSDVKDLLIIVFRAAPMENKKETLQLAKEKIEVVRLTIRIMHELHVIDIKTFVRQNKIVENISKQLNGWHKVSNFPINRA